MDESTFHQSLILFFGKHLKKLIKMLFDEFCSIVRNRIRSKMNVIRGHESGRFGGKLDVYFINRYFQAETDCQGRPSRELAKSKLFDYRIVHYPRSSNLSLFHNHGLSILESKVKTSSDMTK